MNWNALFNLRFKYFALIDRFINFCNRLKLRDKMVILLFLGAINIFASQPFGFFLTLPISFSICCLILDKYEKQRIWLLFSFLFGYFIGQFYWFIMPLTTDISTYWFLLPIAPTFLPLIMTLLIWCPYVILHKYLLEHYRLLQNKSIVILIIAWVFGEFLRANIIFGGFPWMLIGHFVNFLPCLQILRYINIDLYSLFVLLLVLTPYFYLKRWSILTKVILMLWILNTVYGIYVLSGNKAYYPINLVGSQINTPVTTSVSIAENVNVIRKNLAQVQYARYLHNDSLVLFPEATIGLHIENGGIIAKQITQVLPNDKSLLLTGSVIFDNFTKKMYNSIHMLDYNGSVVGIYSKEKLVPFGEYMPLRRIIPAALLPIAAGSIDFSNNRDGNAIAVKFRDLPVLFPIICYEGIFSNLLKKRVDNYFKTHALDKTLIVNLTNDAWMRWSIGSFQHFHMVRITAIRAYAPLVRVSNNGISAFIDEHGRVLVKTRLNKAELLFYNKNNK